MTIALQQLTNSRLSAYKACPRKHYLSYELGIRPIGTAPPLRIGSAVHAGLEARLRGDNDSDALAKAVATLDGFEREMVVAMLNGYWWMWQAAAVAPEIRVDEVIAVELPFSVPIRNPDTNRVAARVQFAGKIDAIVRLGDGRLAVMEHKTTSDDLEPTSDYWTRLRLDHQISGYMIAARELGYDVQTVLYDVLRKPGMRPIQVPILDADNVKVVLDSAGERVRTKDGKKWRESADKDAGYVLQAREETPEEYGTRAWADIEGTPLRYFARQQVPRLDSDLREFRFELWSQHKQMAEARKHGRWFRNTAQCFGFGRCQYLSICANGISTDTVPAGFEQVANVHQELIVQ